MRARRARAPRRAAEDIVCASQFDTQRAGNAMETPPRRISEDVVEASTRLRVGEKGAESEGEGTPVRDAPALSAQITNVLAKAREFAARVPIRSAALAEQVARPLRRDELSPRVLRRNNLAIR